VNTAMALSLSSVGTKTLIKGDLRVHLGPFGMDGS
jgi:hypothetical protein